MKITSVKGMHDVGPPEISSWHRIEKVARSIFENAHFYELRTPPLEEEILFTRGIGNTTDIIEKEMYAFEDRKGRKLALRPEGTASIVRSFIEHYAATQQYERFYYIGPMFRYERPQKGRYRQFYQIGAEVFGAKHPFVDAEVIALAHEIFKTLGLKKVALHLNSLGCKVCRPDYRKALLEFLNELQSKLCEDCQKRILKNPLRVLDCKNASCTQHTQGAPAMFEHLCKDCVDHFEGVQQALRKFSIPYEVNPRMVRGLDYYERTAFEFLSGDLGAQNAVAGGGRYDDLVKDLGGPSVPGIGFAIGLERLVSLLALQESPSSERPKIFLAALGSAAQSWALTCMAQLRKTGFVTFSNFESHSLKHLLKHADKHKADYALIIGDNELQSGKIQIKDMKSQTQKEVPLDSVLAYFESLFPHKER